MQVFNFARLFGVRYTLEHLNSSYLDALWLYLAASNSSHSGHAMSGSSQGSMMAMQSPMMAMTPIRSVMSAIEDQAINTIVDRSVAEGTDQDTIVLNLEGSDGLFGGSGDDLFVLQQIPETVTGGDGHDAVIVSWSFDDTSFELDNGSVVLTHKNQAVALSEIELISFADATVSVHSVIHDLENGAAPTAGSSLLASVWKYLPQIEADGSYDWADVDQGSDMGMSGHVSHEQAVMNLVPASEATIVALKSGDWSDPAIWNQGRIPADGDKVFIPEGCEVTVDAVFDADLFTVRVDGKLAFDTETDTGLTLDTLIIAASGELEIGTMDHPVDGAASAHIIIADNGPIDLAWDPKQLSRGIVALGEVSIHGEEKLTHAKVADAPDAGDHSITLSEVPLNWQVGDTIVITGTEFVPKSYNPATGEYDIYNGTQDEVRTIAHVDGNTVWFAEALQYDHHVPASGLAASVANLSRTVVVETEHADDIPSNQRGHIMFMHNDDVDVRYMQALELGRTDRSESMDDYQTYVMNNEWASEGRVTDADGHWVAGEATNIRGRYAIHFHMAGVETDDTPGYLVGNSVVGSPGWGYVNHDSYAVFEDNVAYDVYGSSFVAETGNEVGRWENNLAIAGEGRETYIKWGTYNMDLGGEGYGYWLNGRSMDLIDNIAVGMSGSGYAWFSRGIDMIETKAENLAYSELARGLGTIHDQFLPFGMVTGNEVYASEVGFTSIRGIEASSQQLNDSRSVISDFAAWDVQQGFHLEYSSSYTIRDGLLISSDVNSASSGLLQLRSAGFNIQRNFEDMVVENVKIEGFNLGIFHTTSNPMTLPRLAEGFEDQSANGWGLRFINVETENVRNVYNPGINRTVSVVDAKSIVSYDLDLDIDNSTLVAKWHSNDARFQDPLAVSRGIVLEGTKYDSLGTVVFPDGNDRIYYTEEQVDALLSQNGYLTDSDGDLYLMIQELITDRRTGDGIVVPMIVAIDPNWDIPEDAYANGMTLEQFQGIIETPDQFIWG